MHGQQSDCIAIPTVIDVYIIMSLSVYVSVMSHTSTFIEVQTSYNGGGGGGGGGGDQYIQFPCSAWEEANAMMLSCKLLL